MTYHFEFVWSPKRVGDWYRLNKYWWSFNGARNNTVWFSVEDV